MDGEYDIYKFIYHLKNCPFDFRRESNYFSDDGIDTNALLLDVLREIDSSFIQKVKIREEEEFLNFSGTYLLSLHLAAWFFSFEYFKGKKKLMPMIESFLFEKLAVLCEYVNDDEWLSDEDRTEEFVRTALLECNIVPDNETMNEALDRLDALSILKRNNILSESKAAFDRVIAIRKQMAEKKAREAANVYGRE